MLRDALLVLTGSWIVGALYEKGWGSSFGRACAAMSLAAGVIFAAGLAWLAAFVPAGNLLQAGLLPFLPGGIIKIAGAAAITRRKG